LLVRAADVNQAEAARSAVELLPASARRDAALGQLALLDARPLDARTLLQAAWDAHDPAADAAVGQDAAIGFGMLFWISGSFTASTIWLDRAPGSATGSEPWYDTVRGMQAIPFTLSGQGEKALSLFDDLPERAAMVPTAKTDSVAYRGIVKLWTGDLQGATDDLDVAVKRIRAGLQVRFPGQPLAFLAEAEFRRGLWDDAQDHAELAVSLARDADLYYDLPIVHSAAARVPACRGDWATAASHVEAAEDGARAFGGFAEIFAASARSILGFARDEPDEALLGASMALAVPEIDCYDDPAAFWWRPLQIWALIRTGQLRDAETILAAFESRAADRSESLALLNAAWLRGLLAMARGELERAVQQPTVACFAMYPETFSHTMRQRIRWMRGSSARNVWRIRYLSMRSWGWWFTVLPTWWFFAFVALLGAIIVDWRHAHGFAISMLYIGAVWGWPVSVRMFAIRRSDQRWLDRLEAFFLVPSAMAWMTVVLRPIRLYGIATVFNQGWNTGSSKIEIITG
jgi:tetratricopeptide (TPR) repeat protein